MAFNAIKINGKDLVLNGITGNAGDRHGVASVEIPVVVDSLAEALAFNAQDVSDALGIGGLICTDRPLNQIENGLFEVRFKFEGFNQEVTFEFADAASGYNFDSDMSEEPIQTHPNFVKIAATYAWNAQDQSFPSQYTPVTGNNSTGFSAASGKTTTNPMAGTTDWLKAGGVFSKTYAVSSVPSSVYQGIGTLGTYPPGAEKLNIPHLKNRYWIKLPPLVDYNTKGSGSACRVTERYRLCGISNGSETVIYNFGQLDS